MTPISSINHSPLSSIRLNNRPVSITSADTQNIDAKGVGQAHRNLSIAVSINLLPQGPLKNVTDIIQQINTQALHSLELGQTFENRQLLQADITENVSNLRTIFEGLSQDDLKLFVALFQNQSLVGPGNSTNNQNFLNNSLSLNGILEDFPENLFRIDVTSQNSSLAALDITRSVLDILSTRDSESRRLESQLESLTELSFINFNSTLIESPDWPGYIWLSQFQRRENDDH